MKLTAMFVAAICCSFALFTACKKSDNQDNSSNNNNNTNNNTPALSARAQLLTAGKWQVSASTATLNYMGKDTTADIYPDMDECEKDDFIQFAADGTATKDENTNVCAGKSQVQHATWVLLNNDNKLAIIDSNPDTFDLEITSTQMILTQIAPNSSGTPVTWVDTYKNIK